MAKLSIKYKAVDVFGEYQDGYSVLDIPEDTKIDWENVHAFGQFILNKSEVFKVIRVVEMNKLW